MDISVTDFKARCLDLIRKVEESGKAITIRRPRLRRKCGLTSLVFVKKTAGMTNISPTLNRKSQITIPKKIRDSLGMKTGDRETFTLMPDGVILMRVKN